MTNLCERRDIFRARWEANLSIPDETKENDGSRFSTLAELLLVDKFARDNEKKDKVNAMYI